MHIVHIVLANYHSCVTRSLLVWPIRFASINLSCSNPVRNRHLALPVEPMENDVEGQSTPEILKT